MSEIECRSEFSAITSVELSQSARDGYREVADFMLASYSRIRDLEERVGHEQLGRVKAETLAELDELTGLKNLRAFNDSFPDLCKLAHETGKPLALFYIDIDGLKRVNEDKERCGYEVGSQLIKLVAERAGTIIRAGDDLYRIGGDEKVVVAPDFTADHPEYAIESQLSRVSAIQSRFESTINSGIKSAAFIPDDLHVGVSVGAAILRPGEVSDAFLKRAEISMDERKRERREELAAYGVLFGDDRMFAE